MRSNQRGFSPLIIVLVIFILFVLGGTALLVMRSTSNTERSLDNATAVNEANPGTNAADRSVKTDTPPADPTADWKTFSSTVGVYAVKYPSTWLVANNLELCSEGLVLLAPTQTSLGKCASEGTGQVAIFSQTGDSSAEQAYGEGYVSQAKTNATVAGVAGVRHSAVASGQLETQVSGGLPDGSKVAKYVFVTGGRTYVASYTQKPGYPDALADFEAIVTQTWQFKP